MKYTCFWSEMVCRPKQTARQMPRRARASKTSEACPRFLGCAYFALWKRNIHLIYKSHIYKLQLGTRLYMFWCKFWLNIYIYIYIYGIHHWRIFRSSYRKLAWVGFEPMTTLNSVRRSKRQSYHTMSLTRSQSQLCAVTPISSLCSEFIFHFGLCLRQLPHLPQVNSRTGNHVSSGMNWCIWYSLLKDF